jgi:hypothetical protein
MRLAASPISANSQPLSLRVAALRVREGSGNRMSGPRRNAEGSVGLAEERGIGIPFDGLCLPAAIDSHTGVCSLSEPHALARLEEADRALGVCT